MSAPPSSTVRRRHPVVTAARRAVALAVALLIGGAIAVPAAQATTSPAATGDEPSAGLVSGAPGTGLVVVGTGGLHWTDIDRTGTPTLWRMVAGGSVGSISVRTAGSRTCPVDAWATVSAGRRWSVPTPAEDGAVTDGSADTTVGVPDGCVAMPTVVAASTGPDGPAPSIVEGWAGLIPDEPVDEAASDGSPGTLAALIAETGACTTAVGPGGAVALADAEGRVARYVPTLADLGPAELTACPVVMVDTGELGEDRAERQDALRALDLALLGLLDDLPDGWHVVVAGISDTPAAEEGLQVVIDWEQGGQVGWLTSDSTRRAGIVTLPDLAATAVAAAGGEAADVVGAPLAVDADRRMSAQRTVENRRYLTEMTTTVTHVMPVFAVVVLLAGITAGLVLWRARRRSAAGPGPVTRRLVTAVLLLVASAPGGAFLAALSRWWVTPDPLVGAAVSAAAGTVLLALVAWTVSRALPAGRWRLAGVSAGLTWLVLTVDGLSGTLLQQGSILGSTPTFGARYYGFGNLAFSVYAASALVLAGALAVLVARAGRPRRTLAVVLAVALVTVTVDGWPGFGADVGGILALVPAFVVLALGVGGSGLTPRRALGAGALALVATTVVGVIDWMGPGPASHLGLFVQRVLDGQAAQVVVDKAAGAWATIANPAGAVATVVCLLVGVLLVGPDRWRPPAVREAYLSWPMLRPVVAAVVVAATLGTLLNDSGISVAVVVLGLVAAVLTASACAGAWFAAGTPAAVDDGSLAPVRRMPTVLLATGAGLLAVLLLGVGFAPLPTVAAGDVTAARGEAVAPAGEPVVLIGTEGVRWQDVAPATTPTLWGLVRDGAAVAGVAPGVVGINGRCLASGWLSLSAGRSAVTGHTDDGTWSCDPWSVVPDPAAEPGSGAGASVAGWAELDALQSSSEFDPRLGVLAESLDGAGVCATAVGPGAALALAGPDGRVQRYRELDAALADRAETFSCPVTVVDLGAVPFEGSPTPAVEPLDPAAPVATPEGPARNEALTGIDGALRRVLAAVPAGATVLVVDVGNPAGGAVSLGIGAVPMAGEAGARFLSTPSTRWEGVVRLLDVPTTLLDAVGAANPAEFTGSPLTAAGTRATETSGVVDQLVDLSVRDQALRGRSGTVTTIPLLVALVLLGLAVLVLPRLAGRPPAARRLRGLVDGTQLLLASLPAGLFLMTAWSWWRADTPRAALWWAMAASTVMVAAVAALVPRRPIWAAPTMISTLTFVLLTVDALLGTPLHRGSPLGPAPTLGGRYYGFGNPTYSIYVVVALVAAAGLGSALLARGRRHLAVAVAGAVALVALVVDLLPTLGADVGGGLVLLPASAIVVLAVARARVTWRRLGLIGVVGVVAVAGVGLLDWMRPPAERSHLGRFVQSALDGTAWETVARKAGYAAATVTSGPTAWLTLALVVAVALLVWPGSPLRARWFSRVEGEWPELHPLVVGLLVAAVGGSLVNDYGTRIATVLLAVAVPLVGLLVVRSLPGRADPPER